MITPTETRAKMLATAAWIQSLPPMATPWRQDRRTGGVKRELVRSDRHPAGRWLGCYPLAEVYLTSERVWLARTDAPRDRKPEDHPFADTTHETRLEALAAADARLVALGVFLCGRTYHPKENP